MPNKADDLTLSSRLERVDEHERRIDSAEDRLISAEGRIISAEERLTRLEDQNIRLENTIMSENRDTRATIVEQNKQLFALIDGVMGFRTGEMTRTYDFNKAKWEHITNMVLKLCGAGGIIYIVIQMALGQ